jgi:hypothetical protein
MTTILLEALSREGVTLDDLAQASGPTILTSAGVVESVGRTAVQASGERE